MGTIRNYGSEYDVEFYVDVSLLNRKCTSTTHHTSVIRYRKKVIITNGQNVRSIFFQTFSHLPPTLETNVCTLKVPILPKPHDTTNDYALENSSN